MAKECGEGFPETASGTREDEWRTPFATCGVDLGSGGLPLRMDGARQTVV